jgi:hypothetical protein
MTKLIVAFQILRTRLKINVSATALSKKMVLEVYSEFLVEYGFSKERERKYRVLNKNLFLNNEP